jgi:hypothetical protein
VRCGGQSPGRVSRLEEPLRWGASAAGGFPSVGDWRPALPTIPQVASNCPLGFPRQRGLGVPPSEATAVPL